MDESFQLSIPLYIMHAAASCDLSIHDNYDFRLRNWWWGRAENGQHMYHVFVLVFLPTPSVSHYYPTLWHIQRHLDDSWSDFEHAIFFYYALFFASSTLVRLGCLQNHLHLYPWHASEDFPPQDCSMADNIKQMDLFEW